MIYFGGAIRLDGALRGVVRGGAQSHCPTSVKRYHFSPISISFCLKFTRNKSFNSVCVGSLYIFICDVRSC